jgi:hypothetical protein
MPEDEQIRLDERPSRDVKSDPRGRNHCGPGRRAARIAPPREASGKAMNRGANFLMMLAALLAFARGQHPTATRSGS